MALWIVAFPGWFISKVTSACQLPEHPHVPSLTSMGSVVRASVRQLEALPEPPSKAMQARTGKSNRVVRSKDLLLVPGRPAGSPRPLCRVLCLSDLTVFPSACVSLFAYPQCRSIAAHGRPGPESPAEGTRITWDFGQIGDPAEAQSSRFGEACLLFRPPVFQIAEGMLGRAGAELPYQSAVPVRQEALSEDLPCPPVPGPRCEAKRRLPMRECVSSLTTPGRGLYTQVAQVRHPLPVRHVRTPRRQNRSSQLAKLVNFIFYGAGRSSSCAGEQSGLDPFFLFRPPQQLPLPCPYYPPPPQGMCEQRTNPPTSTFP
jgi:hypothetical protein